MFTELNELVDSFFRVNEGVVDRLCQSDLAAAVKDGLAE